MDIAVMLAEMILALKEYSAGRIALERANGDKAQAFRWLDQAGEYLKGGIYSDNPTAVDYLIDRAKTSIE